MNIKMHIGFLMLSTMAVLTSLRSQTDTLCASSPNNNYFVINTPGSTYQWSTQGDGIINSGQGTSSVNITWINGPGLYQLSVTETNAEGCTGLPSILNILILEHLESTTNVTVCQTELPFIWNGQEYFSEGTYTFITSGTNGCDSTATLNLSIEEPIVPVITCGASSTNSVSFNWQNIPGVQSYNISYTVNGGMPVIVSGQTETNFNLSGLNPGDQVTIIVTPVGALGDCFASSSQTCQAQDCVPPSIEIVSSNLVACEGSSVNFTANVTGATSLQWQISFNGGATFTNITDGGVFSGANSSVLTISDNSGLNGAVIQLVASELSGNCPSTSTGLSIGVLNSVTAIDFQVACGSFTWIDGVTYTTSTTTPTFIIQGGSAAGCDSIINLNLVVNQPTTSFTSVSICEGSSYTFNGITYNQAGIYIANLTNAAGCDSIATLELTINTSIQISQDITICQGEQFILPDGNSVNASGTYVVTLIANSGCDSVITTTLQVIDAITQNITTSICQGEIYLLPDGTEAIQTGVYTSILTSASGCDSIITINLTVLDAVEVEVFAADNILSICEGTSTILTASGASNFSWTPAESLSVSVGSQVIASPSQTTTYTVVGSTGACSGTAEITITVLPAPALSATPAQSTICFGESVQLNVSGAESYLWFPAIDLSCTDCPNPITTPTQDMVYQVIGAVGACYDTIQVWVNVLNVAASILGDTSVCFSDSLTLTATGGGSYLWSTGDTVSQITVAPLQSSYYYVLVNVGGCVDSAATYVHVRPYPDIHAGNDTTIFPGGTVPILVEGGGYVSLNWSPTTNLTCYTCPNPVASPNVTTTYCVTAESIYGCKVTDCIKIKIDSICGSVFVPNVFSPAEGGHRENDCFRVYGTECVVSFEFSVYSRWGEKVFETKKIDDCWDGTYRGKELNSEVFVYQLKAKLYSGETITKQGNVTLLR